MRKTLLKLCIIILYATTGGRKWPNPLDDKVIYVSNPIEADLPSHWIPLSIIKRVIEMRVPRTSAAYTQKDKKIKLKYILSGTKLIPKYKITPKVPKHHEKQPLFLILGQSTTKAKEIGTATSRTITLIKENTTQTPEGSADYISKSNDLNAGLISSESLAALTVTNSKISNFNNTSVVVTESTKPILFETNTETTLCTSPVTSSTIIPSSAITAPKITKVTLNPTPIMSTAITLETSAITITSTSSPTAITTTTTLSSSPQTTLTTTLSKLSATKFQSSTSMISLTTTKTIATSTTSSTKTTPQSTSTTTESEDSGDPFY
ncbi:cell wall protein DAN4 [Manduca sexta]|uniref:cell wall protein DAN4 n=1 Tax=Manduca sexta TaxID=7130 RepID=UPI00188DCC82|nr:cell wall protein DAN4 [Manduca sexta]